MSLMHSHINPKYPKGDKKLAAFLAALAFFLSTIEYMLPKPLPFLRLGLSNLPLLFAVDLLPLNLYLLLAFIKVLGMSLLSGSLFSYIALFSLAGTMASALVMRFLRFLFGPKYLSYLGLCVAGAVASNLAQLLLARFLVFGKSAKYMTALFLGLGLASGIALGLFAELFSNNSSWLQSLKKSTIDSGKHNDQA